MLSLPADRPLGPKLDPGSELDALLGAKSVGMERWNEPGLWSPRKPPARDGLFGILPFLIPCLSHQQFVTSFVVDCNMVSSLGRGGGAFPRERSLRPSSTLQGNLREPEWLCFFCFSVQVVCSSSGPMLQSPFK